METAYRSLLVTPRTYVDSVFRVVGSCRSAMNNGLVSRMSIPGPETHKTA